MKYLFTFSIFCLCFSGITNAQIYVDSDAPGVNDGTSWSDAYHELYTAIANTDSGEIWVASGIYRPENNSLVNSFELKNKVQIYGGFEGLETMRSERDFANNPTVLSGDMGMDDLQAIADTVTDIVGNNSLHVVFAPSGLDSSAVLDGFIITAGSATQIGSPRLGGGLYGRVNEHETSAFRILNCTFQANIAFFQGAGMSLYGDSLSTVSYRLENCVFRNNVAIDSYGGGLLTGVGKNGLHKPTITACQFIGNWSGTLGGGMQLLNQGGLDSTILSHSNFEANITSEVGGGANIVANNGSRGKLVLDSCIFNANQTNDNGVGGGLHIIFWDGTEQAEIEILRSRFEDNVAGTGAGLSVWNRHFSFSGSLNHFMYLRIEDCQFNQNTSPYLDPNVSSFSGGAEIFSYSGNLDMEMRNCTFNGNSARYSGGLSLGSTNGGNATATIEGCSFVNQQSEQNPAILLYSYGFAPGSPDPVDTATTFANIRNSLFLGNQVVSPLFGSGAIEVTNINNGFVGSAISNCQFWGNISPGAIVSGGALTIRGNRGRLNVSVDSSRFISNEAVNGGAIGITGFDEIIQDVRITDSYFAQNRAENGGAIHLYNEIEVATSLTLEGDTLFHNQASEDGGGLYARNFSLDPMELTLNRNVMIRDSAGRNGGALYMDNQTIGSSQLDMESNLFLGNHAGEAGGAGYIFTKLGTVHTEIDNSTIMGNSAGSQGGAFLFDKMAPNMYSYEMRNTILWGNRADFQHPDIAMLNQSLVSITNSLIEDSSITGVNLIHSDPRFIDPVGPDGIPNTGDDDLRLAFTSEAINAGLNAFVNQPTDLEGNIRIQRDIVDLGAYESPFATALGQELGLQIDIFPNPVKERLNVKLPENLAGISVKIRILDMDGRVVYTAKSAIGDIVFSTSVETLASGSYILMLHYPDRQYTGKFIKQ